MAFDIENFPTSESAQRMMSRVSPIYDNSYVGKWLFEVMGFELDEAREIVESIRKQCFVEQCTWAIGYWEQCFGIESDESLDLETRRGAVITKRGYKRAMSPAAMEDILETLTGREVTVTENNSEYSFHVSIAAGSSTFDQQVLIERIKTIKPSHLTFSVSFGYDGLSEVHLAIGIGRNYTAVFSEYAKSTFTEEEYYQQISSDSVTRLTDENVNILSDEDGNVQTL